MSKQTTTQIESPYINLESACKYLGIAKATMYKKTSEKTIGFFKPGRKILFSVSELQSYVESHRVRTQSEIETEACTRLLTQK